MQEGFRFFKTEKRKRWLMKRTIDNLLPVLGQMDQRRIRFGLMVLTLVLFVLGAGAPGADGGHGG
jgi:hypothetical protein